MRSYVVTSKSDIGRKEKRFSLQNKTPIIKIYYLDDDKTVRSVNLYLHVEGESLWIQFPDDFASSKVVYIDGMIDRPFEMDKVAGYNT